MNTGIYAIENTVNGKMYIGSTVSFDRREREHFSALRNGKHHSPKLQNSYNKHGGEVFSFRPLLICRTEDLLFYEQLLIDRSDVARAGYNIAPTATGGPCGEEKQRNHFKSSQDPVFRAKMSAILRNRTRIPYVKVKEKARLKRELYLAEAKKSIEDYYNRAA